ncbi:MAG TPA: polyprenyl synthetase family protein, partial [Actinomycetes bacterium]
KPAGDDLREGKRTVLVAVTLERCSPAQAGLVRRSLGDPHLDVEGVGRLREVMTDSGALDVVEGMISDLSGQALASLDGVAPPAREVLGQLVAAATARSQ